MQHKHKWNDKTINSSKWGQGTIPSKQSVLTFSETMYMYLLLTHFLECMYHNCKVSKSSLTHCKN